MSGADATRMIPRRSPESAAMLAELGRAAKITAALNRLGFNEAEEARALFAELIGQALDDGFLLIPPFYATGGTRTRVGREVFINQNCTFYDLGGIEIGDQAMIGPNVSLITSGHPLQPSRRRDGVTARPIAIGRNVWIGAGAIVLGGVSIGEDAVIAAGSVVTRDVPPATLAAGNPARPIRAIGAIGEG